MLTAVLGAGTVLLAGLAAAARRDARTEGLVLRIGPTHGARSFRSSPSPFLGALGRLPPMARLRARHAPQLARLVAAAGVGLTAEEVLAVKVLLAAVVPLALAPSLPPIAALGLSVPAAALGFRLPDLVLARAAARRRARIDLGVIDLAELLVATSEAGLSPPAALARALDVLHGPLRSELALAVAEIDLGVPWQLALEHLAQRAGGPGVRRVAVTLNRSARLGASLRGTLRAISNDLRQERRAAAEERARRAPVKMLFPLVFMVLPAFLLLTVGPVVVATLRSLQSGG